MLRLTGQEGQIVYLDRRGPPINVMGVSLCSDRGGADWDATHGKLVPQILSLLDHSLAD